MKKKIVFGLQGIGIVAVLLLSAMLESGDVQSAPAVPRWYVRLEFDPPVVVILHCTRGGIDECAL